MSNDLLLLLADLVLGLHIGVVAFVILSLVLVYAGAFLSWQWVRNPWFRLTHIACIIVVTAQAWAGIVCPLTTLEMWLRSLGGEQSYSGSFISHWMSELLYYDWPAWVFTLIYTGFAALVIGSWFLVRPRPLPRRLKARG